MFPAREIMTKAVLTVHESTPIYKAMRILVQNKISGLPVVDDEGKLCGIISEKDMLELLLGGHAGLEKSVGYYMTRTVTAYGPNTSANEICDTFIHQPIRRVPIVEDGKVIGIVSRRDILSLMLKLRNESSR